MPNPLHRLNDLLIHPFILDNCFAQKLFKRNAKKIDLLMGDPNYEERKNQSRGSQTYQLHADATWLDFVGDTPVDILIVPPVGNYARNHSGKAVDCRC